MHATSRLYRFVAPLAIVAISLVASSQASAQGFSGFGYPQPVAPYAYSPTAGHALGYVSSARPVMVSAPFTIASTPVTTNYANPISYGNSVPVQSFQYRQQPVQMVPQVYSQPVSIQAPPAVPYSQPVSIQASPAVPSYSPVSIQASPAVPFAAPAASTASFGAVAPVWNSAPPQSGCANGMCPLR